MESTKCILIKNQLIAEKYKVLLFIKKAKNAETYRVKGNDGKLYFLKLFNYSKLHRTAFDETGEILEIKFLKGIHHPNIVNFEKSGELIVNGQKYAYLILDFIAGETLAEYSLREPFKNIFDINQTILGILQGLNYLHSLPEPIIHNEITPQNIMLDLSDDTPVVKIIDFGSARLFHQSSKAYTREGLDPNYLATENFNGVFSPQSDIFSVGAIMHKLIFGSTPWQKNISQYQTISNHLDDIILKEREKHLNFPALPGDFIGFDPASSNIMKKALHADTELRFKSAHDFIQAIEREVEIEDLDKVKLEKSEEVQNKKSYSKKTKGMGFDAIAGMKELKDQLQLDVINALKNPSEYERYGLTIPNGMLLYGPPGCGKTFFAKHFAEEVGFNFMLITPSTLKSRYVNATQENIAKMFEEAEKEAPTIIFIDEINELVPNRDSEIHEMAKSAVNEMLAQMDRTGEKGIFIIGATNYPHMIDPAILRAGRLDKKFYLPPPDFEARKAMFQMYLKNRPVDFGIDFDKLAHLTENYVSADIELLVNESSRKALKEKTRITMKILENIIQITKPTVSLKELRKYQTLKSEMESENEEEPKRNERPRIGFKT